MSRVLSQERATGDRLMQAVTPVGLSCVKLLGSLCSSPNPQGLTPCGLTRAGMLPCICEGESSVGTTGREGRFSPIG